MGNFVASHISGLNGGDVDMVAESLRAVKPVAGATKGEGPNWRIAVGFFMAEFATSCAIWSAAVCVGVGSSGQWNRSRIFGDVEHRIVRSRGASNRRMWGWNEKIHIDGVSVRSGGCSY